MKNITLSADEQLIEQAQKQANRESCTLNDLFSNWLRSYVNQHFAAEQFDEILDTLKYVRSGKAFTREELTER